MYHRRSHDYRFNRFLDFRCHANIDSLILLLTSCPSTSAHCSVVLQQYEYTFDSEVGMLNATSWCNLPCALVIKCIHNCHSMVCRSIFKEEKKMFCTLNNENGVGWNKNICNLSCEHFLKVMCILCHKIDLICCYLISRFF